jgi:hypothetical protein
MSAWRPSTSSPASRWSTRLMDDLLAASTRGGSLSPRRSHPASRGTARPAAHWCRSSRRSASSATGSWTLWTARTRRPRGCSSTGERPASARGPEPLAAPDRLAWSYRPWGLVRTRRPSSTVASEPASRAAAGHGLRPLRPGRLRLREPSKKRGPFPHLLGSTATSEALTMRQVGPGPWRRGDSSRRHRSASSRRPPPPSRGVSSE